MRVRVGVRVSTPSTLAGKASKAGSSEGLARVRGRVRGRVRVS